MKVYNTREAIKVLKKNGYTQKYRRGGGDHIDFVNENGNRIVITKKLNRMIWQRLIKENGLEVA